MSALLVAQALLGAMAPTAAYVASQTMTVTAAVPSDLFGVSHATRFHTDSGTGGSAYCGQSYLKNPSAGDRLDRYGSLGIPELDYVMYHGYDGQVVKSIYGLSEDYSYAVTATAVWLAIGHQRPDVLNFTDEGGARHGNLYYQQQWEQCRSGVTKEYAMRLYNEAVAYKNAGGGGPEAGCAVFWRNLNKEPGTDWMWSQGLVTAEKSVPVTFTKLSADAKITDGNSEYAVAGAEYDIYDAADGSKAAHIVTDAGGHASYRLIPNHNYYAVETKAPKGFKLNTGLCVLQCNTNYV